MDKIKEMLKNKKVLTGAVAILAVVVILIIIIAVSCSNNDVEKDTTKSNDSTTVAKLENDTEENTTEPDTEMSKNETTEGSTDASEIDTTEQPTTEQPTEAPTEAPTPQPTEAPTEAPTTVQEQTTIPADYSPTAKYDYYDPEVQRLIKEGYKYPTVDYSTLPVQDFDKYFTKEALGEDCLFVDVEYDENGLSKKFDIVPDGEKRLKVPSEIPMLTLVNWNGRIGYFSDGSLTLDEEIDLGLYTTDIMYDFHWIDVGGNVAFDLLNSRGEFSELIFIYIG